MIIGITVCKGGTGKSTVATSISMELSRNNRVLLVDADVGCPNDHLLLDISRRKIESVYQPVPEWNYDKCTRCGICSKICKYNAIIQVKDKYPIFVEEQCNGCKACIIACPEKAISQAEKKIGILYSGKKNRLDFLGGEILPGQESEEPVVKALLEKIGEYDYVIIDTAAGTHCDVIAALEPCDVAIAVAEPTPFGSHDLDLILGLIEKMEKPNKVVLNKSNIGDKKLIEKIVEKYESEIISEIPYSKEIIRSYAKGEAVKHPSINKLVNSI